MQGLFKLRLPLEPFERMMRHPDQNDSQFSASIGVSRHVLQNWKAHGGIRFYDADKIAIKVGHHPSYFWGEDYWEFPKMHNNMIEIDTQQEEK